MPMFEPLLSTRQGIGPYRLNRYRIYIRRRRGAAAGIGHNRGPGGEATDRAARFKTNFAARFNPNEAEVSHRHEEYNGEGTLRFVLDASAFGSEISVVRRLTPNLHADWVGFEYTHDRGFTVQTLKRNFISGLDWAVMGGSTAAGAVGGGSVLGPWGAVAGGVAGAAGSYGAVRANAYHFLAGRRSWVFVPAVDMHAGDRRFIEENGLEDAVVFETAAVERLSAWWFQLADWTRAMGKFDDSVHKVWVRLMLNYQRDLELDYEAVPVATPGWRSERGVVSYREGVHFPDLHTTRGSDIYGSLSRWHKKMLPEVAGQVV